MQSDYLFFSFNCSSVFQNPLILDLAHLQSHRLQNACSETTLLPNKIPLSRMQQNSVPYIQIDSSVKDSLPEPCHDIGGALLMPEKSIDEICTTMRALTNIEK